VCHGEIKKLDRKNLKKRPGALWLKDNAKQSRWRYGPGVKKEDSSSSKFEIERENSHSLPSAAL
jgi:hypothetical protein